MITIRPGAERGHANHGWLDTYHTFSFDTYYDPANMGFRSLRVINEDRVAPGNGFGMHPHRDMEIITYVLEGALAHKDSLGNGSVILPGDGQRMSAGTGIRHSEFNDSKSDPVHLLQIWLLPERQGIAPSYEQKSFPLEEKKGKLRVIASRDARQGSVKIHQDVSLYVGLLGEGEQVEHRLAPGRHAWLQVARGRVEVNGKTLEQGDGAAVSAEDKLQIRGQRDSRASQPAGNGKGSAEILLFDLA
jgi:quercetin 2,3-dioxygenase